MMNEKTYNIITFLGIMFFLLISAGFFNIGSWVSWVLCVAAIVVIGIPKHKYPALTAKIKLLTIFALSVLIILLSPLQWAQNA